MSLIKKSTKWVLFLSSSEPNPEDRHVLDLVFGLMCLEKAGINHNDIHIYVDGKDRSSISTLFSIASDDSYEIKQSSDFFEDLKNNSHENLVMFVTGHGSESGIDATQSISPHSLVQSIKVAPNLQQAVVYLGQCYAGIFNYVSAGRRKGESDSTTDIVLIGATKLQESLSSSTAEQFPNYENPISWLANVFLLYVFKWVSTPFDVDGDSKNTIMDSYKYAGVMTNRSQKMTKATAFIDLMNDYENLKAAQLAVNVPTGNPQIDMQNIVKLKAIKQKYHYSSYLNNIHQECWILNSIPAQCIEF